MNRRQLKRWGRVKHNRARTVIRKKRVEKPKTQQVKPPVFLDVLVGDILYFVRERRGFAPSIEKIKIRSVRPRNIIGVSEMALAFFIGPDLADHIFYDRDNALEFLINLENQNNEQEDIARDNLEELELLSDEDEDEVA